MLPLLFLLLSPSVAAVLHPALYSTRAIAAAVLCNKLFRCVLANCRARREIFIKVVIIIIIICGVAS